MSSESWSEIDLAEQENRRELVLSGAEISQRIEKAGDVDPKLYTLTKLNFLEISKTCFRVLSPKVSDLQQMTNLILQGNKITEIPSTINQLKKLKIFDVSHNELEELPSEMGEISELHSLFIGSNKLTEFPSVTGLKNLHELDISHNKLAALPEGITSPDLAVLNKVNAAANSITELPLELSNLPMLKTLDVSENKLTTLPSDMSQCPKLHLLRYGGNKLSDKRLARMGEQCSTKAVLDYLRKIYDKEHAKEGGKGGKGKKKKKGKGKKEEEEDLCLNMMRVLHFNQSSSACEIRLSPSVADVRPYIVCCIVRNLDLQKTNNMFKNFITLQTRLHDGVCAKRQTATIATHDLSAVKSPLLYDARPPAQMQLTPLFKQKPVTAQKLVDKLRQEAEEFRKEKRRSTLSGIHKYLDLLKGKRLYPCLVDSEDDIVSFPPITNCDKTKISAETTDLLIEVTSTVNLDACKRVLQETLQGMLEMGLGSRDAPAAHQDSDDDDITFEGAEAGGDTPLPAGVHSLTVEQVRILDEEGSMKVVYPARNDLLSEAFRVVRDYD